MSAVNGLEYAVDFWVIYLVEDNAGLTQLDVPAFANKYLPSSDPYIYIANLCTAGPLNQYSSQVYDIYANSFTFGYDLATLGTWKFRVMPCIDWPDFDAFDCAIYIEKYFTITLLDPCIDPDLDLVAANVTESPCDPGESTVVIVVDGEEIVVDEQDLTPFFEDWDADTADEVIELAMGEEFVYDIPEALDCCNNRVEVTVDIRGIASFTKWLKAQNQILFTIDS